MSNTIKKFKEINEYFEAIGLENRTDIPDFYIFPLSDLNNNIIKSTRPYQKDFYHLTVIHEAQHSTIAIDYQPHQHTSNVLYFLSPDHIFSWTAQENIKGLSLYFKKSFLDFYSGTFEFDFSFFNLSEHNILELPQSTITAVSEEFEHILREYRASNPYRIDILKPLLLSLLFKCKSIIEEACLPELNHSQLLWHKFKNLLHNLYITHKQVSDYANQLNVSPYTLNKTVKELTGKSPKEIITDKILEESKKMLTYTVCDVSEIAYALGFPEPTHFVRFFKNQTQQTPNQYRSLLF